MISYQVLNTKEKNTRYGLLVSKPEVITRTKRIGVVSVFPREKQLRVACRQLVLLLQLVGGGAAY